MTMVWKRATAPDAADAADGDYPSYLLSTPGRRRMGLGRRVTARPPEQGCMPPAVARPAPNANSSHHRPTRRRAPLQMSGAVHEGAGQHRGK